VLDEQLANLATRWFVGQQLDQGDRATRNRDNSWAGSEGRYGFHR
jgi:hypothetical protein